MIKSMTGYGSAKSILDHREITFEIRSVNHRYFDFSARVPRAYGFLEERLKSFANSVISRGKVDVFVSVTVLADDNTQVTLNEPLLRSYLNALGRLADDYALPNDISVSTVARYTDIFSVTHLDDDKEALWDCVRGVGESAVKEFLAMREKEGARLQDDMAARARLIEAAVDRIEELSADAPAQHMERLRARVAELAADVSVDEERLVSEIALYADRINTTEEIVRLRSHLHQFGDMLQSDVPIGRKMDFLIQEMNREINTIGSKANQLDISRLVIDVKAEIEKLREQVQNIE